MRADDEFSRERRPSRRGSRPAAGARMSREDRRSMKRFVKTRTGVEAYVEPRTLDQSFSVVLVASDGEWLRFRLPDDRYLKKLSDKLRMPIYDAGRMGYPKRMKEYRRDEDSPG
jgi:hypothetical protein